jgi:hypothetical protein
MIIKVNYTRSRAKIKASIRYITHRPTLTGERTTRALFGQEGIIDKQKAYQMIEEAPRGTVFFRLAISPDPRREDTRRDLDLKDITRKTILSLEKHLQRRIQFLATEHNDHSDIRHIHAIVMVRLTKGERLRASDYKLLREAATDSALFQRRALDLAKTYQLTQHHHLNSARSLLTPYSLTPRLGGRAIQSRGGGRVKSPRRTCPDCGFRQQMYAFSNGVYWCPTCHLKLNQNKEQIRHLQLEL